MHDQYSLEDVDSSNYSDYVNVINSIKYICKYSGYDESNINILDEILNPELPQNGKKENNYIKGLRTLIANEALAWIQYYENFQNNKTVFLGELYVSKEHQKKGIGKYLFNLMQDYWRNKGFNKIVLNVDLKNWHAIRFWVKNGFNIIESVMGDLEYSDNTYANMRLSKII